MIFVGVPAPQIDPQFDVTPAESGCCPTQLVRGVFFNRMRTAGFVPAQIQGMLITPKGIVVWFNKVTPSGPVRPNLDDETSDQVWTTFVPFVAATP